jgi:hypothetical protein
MRTRLFFLAPAALMAGCAQELAIAHPGIEEVVTAENLFSSLAMDNSINFQTQKPEAYTQVKTSFWY